MKTYEIYGDYLNKDQMVAIAEIVEYLASKLEVMACLSKGEIDKIFRSRKCLSAVLAQNRNDLSFVFAFYETIDLIVKANAKDEDFRYAHNWYEIQKKVFMRWEYEIELFIH